MESRISERLRLVEERLKQLDGFEVPRRPYEGLQEHEEPLHEEQSLHEEQEEHEYESSLSEWDSTTEPESTNYGPPATNYDPQATNDGGGRKALRAADPEAGFRANRKMQETLELIAERIQCLAERTGQQSKAKATSHSPPTRLSEVRLTSSSDTQSRRRDDDEEQRSPETGEASWNINPRFRAN